MVGAAGAGGAAEGSGGEDVCIILNAFVLFGATSGLASLLQTPSSHLPSCSAFIMPLLSRSITSHSHELKARVSLSSFAISAHTCTNVREQRVSRHVRQNQERTNRGDCVLKSLLLILAIKLRVFDFRRICYDIGITFLAKNISE